MMTMPQPRFSHWGKEVKRVSSERLLFARHLLGGRHCPKCSIGQPFSLSVGAVVILITQLREVRRRGTKESPCVCTATAAAELDTQEVYSALPPNTQAAPVTSQRPSWVGRVSDHRCADVPGKEKAPQLSRALTHKCLAIPSGSSGLTQPHVSSGDPAPGSCSQATRVGVCHLPLGLVPCV